MKVSKAIEVLKEILKEHGDAEVYFDCPNCKQSFCPGVIVTQAIHLNIEKK